MNKTLIALSTAVFGAAMLVAPVAEAGGCGGGGGYSSYKRSSYRSVKRSVKPRVSVAQRKVAKPVEVAKVENPEAKSETVEKVAAVENSSITAAPEKTAAAPVKVEKTETAKAETTEKKAETTEKVATAAKDVGCKQFFPTIGQVLSVPCQK